MSQNNNKEICPYCGKPVGFLSVRWKSKKRWHYKSEWEGKRVHLTCESKLVHEGTEQNNKTCTTCVYVKESHKFALETGLIPLPRYECGKLGIELISSNMPKPNECPYHKLRKELFKQIEEV
jgi:hypothetical protein